MTYHYIAFFVLSIVCLFFIWKEWSELIEEEKQQEKELKEFYENQYYSSFNSKKED